MPFNILSFIETRFILHMMVSGFSNYLILRFFFDQYFLFLSNELVLTVRKLIG
jgi:hypothetical protein